MESSTEESVQEQRPEQKQTGYRPVEVEMSARLFKQSLGVMSAVSSIDERLISMRLDKEGFHAQMRWEDNSTVVDAIYPASILTKFVYEDEHDNLQFAVKSKYIKALVKRLPKKDDGTIAFKIDEDSNLVVTFGDKLYRLPMQRGEDKIIQLRIGPSAKVMVDLKAVSAVIDDMMLELNTQYTIMRFTIETIEGGKVRIKQTSRNPTSTLYETVKGEGWSVTGSGSSIIEVERMQLLKHLVATNVMLEFGTQEVERVNKDTGEKEKSIENTPLLVTVDEGYVKFATNTHKE